MWKRDWMISSSITFPIHALCWYRMFWWSGKPPIHSVCCCLLITTGSRSPFVSFGLKFFVAFGHVDCQVPHPFVSQLNNSKRAREKERLTRRWRRDGPLCHRRRRVNKTQGSTHNRSVYHSSSFSLFLFSTLAYSFKPDPSSGNPSTIIRCRTAATAADEQQNKIGGKKR